MPTIYIDGKRKGNSPAEKGQTFALKLTEGEYLVEAVKPVAALLNFTVKKRSLSQRTRYRPSLLSWHFGLRTVKARVLVR